MDTLRSQNTHSAGKRSTLSAEEEVTLLSLFFSIDRTLHMVGRDNETFTKQFSRFMSLAQSAEDETGAFSIKVSEDRIYINNLHSKHAHKVSIPATSMALWKRIELGGVELHPRKASDSLISFFEILGSQHQELRDVSQLRGELADRGAKNISIYSVHELADLKVLTDEERVKLRRAARSVFFRSLRTIDLISNRFGDEDTATLKKSTNVVHSLIDQLIRDDGSLLEMTAIKDFDDYTFAHSLNVCIYSLTIGMSLGMSHKQLSQLGFAALFHDLGKTKIPSDVVKKSGAFDEDDWNHMRRHPALGARMILKTFGIDKHAVRGALIALEHHMNMDNTGYPRRKQPRDLNLYTRITTVADTYDALTSGRIYMSKRISPLEALKRMQYQMHNKYDQLILKSFINTIGLFPPGTLTLLSDKRLAIVEETSRTTFEKPVVRIIGDSERLYERAQQLDLAEPENLSISIVRCIDPDSIGIDVKNYILSEETL